MSTLRNSLLLIASFLFGFLGVYTANIVSAHGGDTSRIHACVSNNTGGIKIVDANATCKNNETPLDWNIQGSSGTLQTAIRTGNPAPDGVARAFCLPGEKVLGGGFSSPTSFGFDSYPSTDLVDSNGNTVQGWIVMLSYAPETTSYAICAS